MKIAIYGREFNLNYVPPIQAFFNQLQKVGGGMQIAIYKPFYDFLQNKCHIIFIANEMFASPAEFTGNYQYIFSIGGDGTILETLTFVRTKNIPVVGINTGRLGFLSNTSIGDVSDAVDAIFNKQYTFEKRTILEFNAQPKLFENCNYALNEITIHKLDSSSMITIHVYLNDEYLNSYWADGLIISTPTGSTAYSLSVGGPIVVPEANVIVISPIAPHNLTVRPIVVPDNVEIKLKVEGRCEKFLATLDSRSEAFTTQYDVVIKKADFTFNLLKLKGQSFCTTLRNKLMWGLDKRN